MSVYPYTTGDIKLGNVKCNGDGWHGMARIEDEGGVNVDNI